MKNVFAVTYQGHAMCTNNTDSTLFVQQSFEK